MAEQGSTTAQAATEAKGKYKAENPPQDVSMDEGEGDDSSDEETGAEEEVPNLLGDFGSFHTAMITNESPLSHRKNVRTVHSGDEHDVNHVSID